MLREICIIGLTLLVVFPRKFGEPVQILLDHFLYRSCQMQDKMQEWYKQARTNHKTYTATDTQPKLEEEKEENKDDNEEIEENKTEE